MKKFNILVFFSLCYFFSQAQISFLNSNMPTLPWTNAEQEDTMVSDVINTNFGNKGPNQVYDFSSFHNRKLDTGYYTVPTTPQTTAVPNANLSVTGDHVTYLLGQNATNYFVFDGLQTQVGANSPIITKYSQLDTYYKFPTVYNQNFRGTYGGAATVPASQVGITTFGADSVKITNTTIYTDTIDGWGRVKTPIGTYNCLRQKRVENSTTVVAYSTIISPNSYTTYETVTSTTLSYNYLTKETHGSVIAFTYDSINQPITVSWTTTPATLAAHWGYTTGGSPGAVLFSDSSTGPNTITYSWNFGDGSPAVTTTSPTHTYMQNGTYYVCETVSHAGSDSTICDSVHVSNALAAARVPKAINDTASIIQPGSVTINVLANDSNFNSPDTVCVTSVYGPAAASATVSGCSQIVFQASATAGLDTFYYKSCDTHTGRTTLCDTGMVVVTVRVALPTADFSYTASDCGGAELRSSSLNADSISWNIDDLQAGTDSVYNELDSVHYGVGKYTRILVCLTAKNTSGTNQMCDTIQIVCEGINEISPADYRIYPNPASSVIQLDLSRMDQSTLSSLSEIVIYDMLGDKLKTVPVSQTSISVSDLSDGLYLIGVVDKAQNRKILGKFDVLK